MKALSQRVEEGGGGWRRVEEGGGGWGAGCGQQQEGRVTSWERSLSTEEARPPPGRD